MSTETAIYNPDELWHHVKSLEHRVDALERRVDPVKGAARPSGKLGELLPAVERITQELFPGEVVIEEVDDPDFPGDSYTVVKAKAAGTIDDIVERRVRWHQRVNELSDRCRSLCLSLSDQT